MAQKILATSRKAFYRFEILEKFEAGIVLTGSEAKSAKSGGLSLDSAYAILNKGECWLLNCRIAPYAYDSSALRNQQDASRTKKLLLHKKEINRLAASIQSKGLTLIPIEAYANPKGVVKVVLATARGKKGPDRRDDIKKRDLERELRRNYKVR